jgi:hypothetical protein
VTTPTFPVGSRVRVTGPHRWTDGTSAAYVDGLEPDPARVFVTRTAVQSDGDVRVSEEGVPEEETGGGGWIAATSLSLVEDDAPAPETSGGFEEVDVEAETEALEGELGEIDFDAFGAFGAFLDSIDVEEIVLRRAPRVSCICH